MIYCTTKRPEKPMLVIHGQDVLYRSRLIRSLAAAQRFARMIDANPCFEHAMVCARGTGWYVEYRPVNPARQEDLKARLQQERVARAEAEMDGWAWADITLAPGTKLVRTRPGQDPYETDGRSCTCRDFYERCAQLGILCKHAVGYHMLPTQEEAQPTPQTQTCRPCDGTGRWLDGAADDSCSFCAGTGRRPVK